MKSLYSALLAARLAAGVLPRDDSSPPRRGAPGFDFPSQEALQGAARELEEHGLLLLPDGAELGEEGKSATFAWQLLHVESGEFKSYQLEWPLFSDLDQRAHQFAAAWAHAWRHLIMQLLALRVAPRSVGGIPLRDDLAPWAGGQGVPSPVIVPRTATPMVEGYSAEKLVELVRWWGEREEEHDTAEGRPARTRTLADAWFACSGVGGGARPSDLQPLFRWLTEQKARAA